MKNLLFSALLMFGLTSMIGQVANTNSPNNLVAAKQTKKEAIINNVITETLELANSQIADVEIQSNSMIAELETEVAPKKIYTSLKRTVKIIREEKQLCCF